jgi:hypothetical protein
MAKRFRTTQMHQAGTDPALIVQGRVVNVNLPNWTVDVAATFDRKRYFDIQVGTPYAHYSAGEGFSIVPDVGAQCMVCVPGDSAPPFVLCFVMPHETASTATTDAPSGSRSHGNTPANATDASYAAGRPLPQLGDMWIRGRDGNFIILHRGGVLSIGSTSLAQRMYIPLGNLVTDITGQYQHLNTGGAHTWTIQEGPAKTHVPTQHLETYRVFGDSQYADIRITKGSVFNPMPEPDGGTALSQTGVGQGKNNEICYDVAVSPGGFDATTGDVANSGVSKASVFRFVFDQEGNTLTRIEGNFYMHVTGTCMLDLADDMTINGQKSLTITMKNGVTIDGGSMAALKGEVVLLGPGKTPVALLGGAVTSTIFNQPCVITLITPAATTSSSGPGTVTPGVPIMATLTVGTIAKALPIGGSIATGSYTVKA